MNLVDGLIEQAKARHPGSPKVVFAEGGEPRVQQAAEQLAALGVCTPVLLGQAEYPVPESHAAHFAKLRAREVSNAVRKRLARPAYHGALMVGVGDAQALVAGAVLTTRQVVEAASLCIGYAPGVRSPSSCFLMAAAGWPEPLVFADCALQVQPDADELADIAIISAASAARLLGTTPRVAVLASSTLGSGQGPQVALARAAVERVRERAPELLIEGELQADAALNMGVAARKVDGGGAVAGRANVLIFPDLASGNIGYKLVQQLSGAQAVGPLLQGFAGRVADLSRGAGVDEIVATTVATLA